MHKIQNVYRNTTEPDLFDFLILYMVSYHNNNNNRSSNSQNKNGFFFGYPSFTFYLPTQFHFSHLFFFLLFQKQHSNPLQLSLCAAFCVFFSFVSEKISNFTRDSTTTYCLVVWCGVAWRGVVPLAIMHKHTMSYIIRQ